MNQKKNRKIMIIVIIILIVILCAGAAFAFLATDMFKSNKELFFKYMFQIGDEENGFISKELKEYIKKKENTQYKNDSKITFSIPEEYYKNTEIMNNFNITFSGQVDSKNSKVYQDININYSEDVKFPLTYMQDSNIYRDTNRLHKW